MNAPDAMDMLARAVRAGYAFTSGLQLIADELSDPVAEEFRATYDQQNLGLPGIDSDAETHMIRINFMPEPGSLLMIAGGFVGLLALQWRQRSRRG